MYSAAVLDHFKNPRNAGELPDATVQVEVSNPACGDVLQLSAQIEDGCILVARFKAKGCVTSVACASLLTEMLSGLNVREAAGMTPGQVAEALGGLPPSTMHGAQLAVDALQQLLKKVD